MASNKAYYWVALAVLVLGLNSEYQRGRMQPLHRLVSRSAATVNCLAMRAEQYVELARVLVGGNPKAPAATEWAHAIQRESGDFSRMEAELANLCDLAGTWPGIRPSLRGFKRIVRRW